KMTSAGRVLKQARIFAVQAQCSRQPKRCTLEGVEASPRFNGRSGGIRTHDPLTPSQVRYRAALHSEPRKALYSQGLRSKRRIGRNGEKWNKRGNLKLQ